jgi:Leucine-rich repeat (LRR) protein
MNNLMALPESFGNLRSLRKLNLHSNTLKVLPHAFGNLQSLQELDLHLDWGAIFPHSFLNLQSLHRLTLELDGTTPLPDLTRLPHLGSLNLSHVPEDSKSRKILDRLRAEGRYVRFSII